MTGLHTSDFPPATTQSNGCYALDICRMKVHYGSRPARWDGIRRRQYSLITVGAVRRSPHFKREVTTLFRVRQRLAEQDSALYPVLRSLELTSL